MAFSHIWSLVYSIASSTPVCVCIQSRVLDLMAGGEESRTGHKELSCLVMCEAKDLVFGAGVSGAGPCVLCNSPKKPGL